MTEQTSNPSKKKKRIVIIGGGFGGVYTAMYLEKKFGRSSEYEIALVNKENYFVFQPLLAEVVSGNIGILDTINPLRRLAPKSQIYVRECERIDLENQKVILSPGFWPRELELDYDHLVLALGTVTDFRNSPGLHEHALPFKNLDDAIQLRNHIIRAVSEASIETDPARQKQLLTFVIAGGGFSGVEVAAEINDFVRRLCKNERRLQPSQARVVLVHSGDRVLQRELTESLSKYATEVLQKRGVHLLLGHRLKTATPDGAILDTGERLPTRTVVSTVPAAPHPLIESLDLPKIRGKLDVDGYCRVKDQTNIWALGDCALVPTPDGEGACPPTAQHAIRQAKVVAGNIGAEINDGEKTKFAFEGLGKLGALGHRCAVAELFNSIRLKGFLAWFCWRTIYWSKLPGIDRKIKVGLAWALDLLIPPESVQLKVGQKQGITQVHYEPGDVIFSQGDLGDSLFLILEGEVAAEIEENGERRVVASMGPGEQFGEMALLSRQPRSATVRCTKSMTALTIPKGDFNLLTSNLPQLKTTFDDMMEERLLDNATASEATE